ncbi:hypothetical protein M9458_012778, partial [Cirrhinus mrigala]
KRAQLLPVDNKARPALVLLRHHSRPVHARVGLHPRELQKGLPGEQHRVLRAGPDGPVHHLGADQLPAAAAGREPAGRAAQRHLPAAQETPGVRQAHAAVLDDAGPAGQRPVRRLPVQRHRRKLGAQAARLGHADGELADGGRHQDARRSRSGSVPRAGSREDEEENGSRGEGGGAVPSSEWTQLLS